MYWVTRPGSEDYYFLPQNKQMVLYSGFAEGEYDAEQDLDYISMRSGYSHIKRMLLKLRTWPEVVDERTNLADRVKYILKGTLKLMANFIAEFLRENREKIVALRQAWEACEVPPEADFQAGIKRSMASTPGDCVDGPKLKKIVKAFNAAVPNVLRVSCSSTETTTEEDPYLISAQSPFNRLSARELLAHQMSGNQECALTTFNEEELYNLVVECESPIPDA